jgi:predicted O-methyltransferase YrrM
MILQKAAGAAGRLTHRILHNKRQLEVLRLQGDAQSRAIADAIAAMGQAPRDAHEKKWVERIEQAREELGRSEQFVPDLLGPMPADLKLPVAGEAHGNGNTVGTICRMASKNRPWALTLFRLVRALDPKGCLELGTCLGVSAAYQAAALQVNGSGGRLTTLEGNPYRATIARENLSKLGLDRVEIGVGLFTETLQPALEDLGVVDYAFIDGHHDGKATVAYYRAILPFLAERSVVIFDDIAWTPDMKRAWAEITADPRIVVAVDLFKVGICVVAKEPGKKVSARIAVD